jgi:hypothetical protein
MARFFANLAAIHQRVFGVSAASRLGRHKPHVAAAPTIGESTADCRP